MQTIATENMFKLKIPGSISSNSDSVGLERILGIQVKQKQKNTDLLGSSEVEAFK